MTNSTIRRAQLIKRDSGGVDKAAALLEMDTKELLLLRLAASRATVILSNMCHDKLVPLKTPETFF